MIEKHSWKPVTNTNGSNAKPSPRWGHSSCVIGDELVLFGGYAGILFINTQILSTWMTYGFIIQSTCNGPRSKLLVQYLHKDPIALSIMMQLIIK